MQIWSFYVIALDENQSVEVDENEAEERPVENEENVNTSDSDSAFHPNRKSLSIAIDSNSMADDGNLIQDNNIITDIIRRSIRVRSTRVNSRVAALASPMATNGWEAKESVLHSSATNGLRRVHSSRARGVILIFQISIDHSTIKQQNYLTTM